MLLEAAYRPVMTDTRRRSYRLGCSSTGEGLLAFCRWCLIGQFSWLRRQCWRCSKSTAIPPFAFDLLYTNSQQHARE